ncbi:MAG: DUF6132 family protein [candidate division KSB1 bacterium]|nr:DUF6132 family protein [candidate division KSB1 bacterium]MDZ7335293.1 DUF6132 family protein [candidate division KSB1 bacterium]MDZ7399094.1 DUF6132 family protein [candidate division KSB1 bacterium]
MKSYIFKALIVVVGGVLGYAYYYYVGCRTGTCPITSNPWISTGYGALFALVLVWGTAKKKRDNSEKES